jgi:hypothetical protein
MSFQTKQTVKSMPKQKYEREQYERQHSPSPEPVYEKQKYEVPSKESYFLDRCDQPMEEICEETNYFQLIPDDIKIPMLKFICEHSRKNPSVYGEYDAPPDQKIVESINGQGGYFLKKTTEAADIYLIWHNQKKNVYKFWGASERTVRDAMNRLRGRIVKHVVHGQGQAHARVEKPRQEPAKYNVSAKYNASAKYNDDIASSPPPSQNSSIHFSPVFKEDDLGWTANFVASAEYCRPPLMRTDSMAIADAYDNKPENDEDCQPRLCRCCE